MTIEVQFFGGDSKSTDGHVLHNDVSIFDAASTDSSPTYSATRSVTGGDRVDIVVGAAEDGYLYDSTPLTIVITLLK